LISWLKNTVLASGNISKEDLDIFTIVDSPQEVIKVIKKFYVKD